MKATADDLLALGARIKVARERHGLSRPAFSEKFGCTVRTLENNEGGKNEPGACLIASFALLGVNTNWLLTGEGPMLLADTPPAAAGSLDRVRLRLTLQTVEESLAEAGNAIAPDRKAELVVAVYDLFEESSVSKERVSKLVKLVV